MKKIFYVFVFGILINVAKSQINIVTNPSFDNITSGPCPAGTSAWTRCANWTNPSGTGTAATPDYYNTCATGYPTHSGAGMMGLALYNGYGGTNSNGREYITNYLNCPMLPGITYTVSFYITNGNPASGKYTIDKVGVLFSSSVPTQSGLLPILTPPQFQTTVNVATTSWIQYTFTIMPTAVWNNMTIGNFNMDDATTVINTYPTTGGPYAYYYFDDISVLKPATLPFSLNASVTQPTCGATGSATITPSIPVPGLTYTWSPGGYHTSSVSGLNPGVYTITAQATGCNSVNAVTHVTIVPTPTVNVSTTNVNYCTNSSSSAAISASSTFTSGPVSYYWQPSFQTGQTVNVSPLVNTVYTVTASSPLACPSTATMAVTTITNCCSQSTVGLTALSGNLNGSYSNTSYFIDQTITLSGSTSFIDAEVLMMPGVQIIVPSGVTLDLNHTHLYACGITMWQGIVVQDGGQVTSPVGKSSTMIEDAVTAIDIDNISAAAATPPLDIHGIIFNKNYTGIKLSNSNPLITTLPLNMSECVFTSRQMAFTSPAPFSAGSWPNADVSLSGLRYGPAVSASGLTPPYVLQGYSPITIKAPYAGQTANTGIKINNIGNQTGIMPASGIDIGVTYPTGISEFNLFDGLQTGIDVQDASLTTMNNIFQNSDKGINHKMTGLMNSVLDLRPAGSGNQSTDYGNRFWNCNTAIETYNVFEVNIEYGIFRSDRKVLIGYGPGSFGIKMMSNRFKYNIQFSEFNNIDNCITANVINGAYDMGSGVANDVYADDVMFNQNYFGPELNSSLPVSFGARNLNYAITMQDLGGGKWLKVGKCTIISNKIDRAYRGIFISDMQDYSTEIGGNDIKISDDNYLQPGIDQYGIFAAKSKDNLLINQNTIRGDGPTNTSVKLIRSLNNISFTGGFSPVITCNQLFDAYIGFEFENSQPNTIWAGNTMYQQMTKGLSLVNSGEIGIQGNSVQGCADKWDDNGNTSPNDWASNFQTYVDATSNASPGSMLWCETSILAFPLTNGTAGGTAFAAGVSINKSGPADCLYPTLYPGTPTQRLTNNKSADKNAELTGVWSAEVFPNPASDNISIKSTFENETLNVKIMDVTGKVVYSGKTKSNVSNTLDVSSLKAAIYFIEIQNVDFKIVHKKLIKN